MTSGPSLREVLRPTSFEEDIDDYVLSGLGEWAANRPALLEGEDEDEEEQEDQS